jgi:hypothetical protein
MQRALMRAVRRHLPHRKRKAMIPDDIATWLFSNLSASQVEYLRGARAANRKLLRELGVAEGSELGQLYLNFGPDAVHGWYELLDLEEIREATEYAHEELGVPKHYLALSGLEGDGVVLYHLETGAVFDVTRGQFELLEQERLPPIAPSVAGYIQWCKDQT